MLVQKWIFIFSLRSSPAALASAFIQLISALPRFSQSPIYSFGARFGEKALCERRNFIASASAESCEVSHFSQAIQLKNFSFPIHFRFRHLFPFELYFICYLVARGLSVSEPKSDSIRFYLVMDTHCITYNPHILNSVWLSSKCGSINFTLELFIQLRLSIVYRAARQRTEKQIGFHVFGK